MNGKEVAEVPVNDVDDDEGWRRSRCNVCGPPGLLDGCGTCSLECCEKHERDFMAMGVQPWKYVRPVGVEKLSGVQSSSSATTPLATLLPLSPAARNGSAGRQRSMATTGSCALSVFAKKHSKEG